MKSKFNFSIEYPTGETIDLHDINFWVSSFRIHSPSSNYYKTYVEGVHGSIVTGYSLYERVIIATIQINGYNPEDFDLIRDKVFHVFRPGAQIKIMRDLQKGKVIDCFVEGEFDIEYETCEDGYFQVRFLMPLPFLRSIGTTQEINANGLDMNSGLWGFGMGLTTDIEAWEYEHTGTSFRIYNAGNVRIHPFQQNLKITIDNVIGSTEFLQLKNNTNGTTFKVNEAVTNTQTIELDGPNITSNGLQFLRKTNKQFIELEPGWNEFVVTGCTSATVNFDFPFYYL